MKHSHGNQSGNDMPRRARGTGQIKQVGDVWKIRYTIKGKRVQETAGPRKADAVELLAKRLGAVADGRLTADSASMTWADLERIILAAHEQHRSNEKVKRHVRRHCSRLLKGRKVKDIGYDRMLEYKDIRLAEGASPSTVRYEISLVRTGLVIAHKAGRLAVLPPMPSVHVENTRTSFFEPSEFDNLIKHMRTEPNRRAVTFLYWTGWRRNEALTREWRHVDFARGTIVLEPGETKNGKGRELPFDVLPELLAVLTAARTYTDEVELRTGQVVRWVFHREGRRMAKFRDAWRVACRKAGLIGKIPHDFRRTAVRRLERAGVSRKVAMQIVGHETEAIYNRYAITNGQDVREGLEKIARQKPKKRALNIS